MLFEGRKAESNDPFRRGALPALLQSGRLPHLAQCRLGTRLCHYTQSGHPNESCSSVLFGAHFQPSSFKTFEDKFRSGIGCSGESSDTRERSWASLCVWKSVGSMLQRDAVLRVGKLGIYDDFGKNSLLEVVETDSGFNWTLDFCISTTTSPRALCRVISVRYLFIPPPLQRRRTFRPILAAVCRDIASPALAIRQIVASPITTIGPGMRS